MADDYSADDTADLLGLADFSHSSRSADDPIKQLQQPKWQPSSSRTSSRRSRSGSGGGEKLYQGRASIKQTPLQEPESPPWVNKPKLETKSSSKSPPTQTKQRVEVINQRVEFSKRPKRLSQSTLSADKRHQHKQEKRLSKSSLSHDRERAMSDSSCSSDSSLDFLNDGPTYNEAPTLKQRMQRRRSRSASPLKKKPPPRRPSLQRRPSASLQRRPSIPGVHPSSQRRPSIQNERPRLRRASVQEASSRSLLSSSMRANEAFEAFSRRNSFTTYEVVPLKDEPRSGRGRSRNDDGKVRRRSRSLDAKEFGRMRNDLIAVEQVPLSGKTMNRKRSTSWDSGGSEHNEFVEHSDFKDIMKKRKERKEAEAREAVDTHEDMEDRKASVKAGLNEARARHSMPAVRATKKDVDKITNKKEDRENRKASSGAEEKTEVKARARHSMPAVHTTKKDEEKNKQQRNSMPARVTSRDEENQELQAGASPRRRNTRRAKASAGYARLQQSVNASLIKMTRRRRPPPPRPPPPAAAAVPPVAAYAGVASRENTEEIDVEESSRRKKKKGCFCSRFMMTVLCFLYIFSLVGVFALGFWVHMDFFAYKDTNTTMYAYIFGNGTGDDSPNGSTGESDEMSVLRPSSFSPPGPSPGVNLQPTPADGGLGTKVSQVPAMPSISPSSSPTAVVSDSPSSTPTVSPYPTSTPSISPSNQASESPSSEPTVIKSETPSFSPTVLDECPETLSRSMPFISDTSLTLYYETVIYRDHPTGGLLCASLEYSGAAGWMGIAFSTAGRNPQFGRREAIIGMPGVDSSVAVSAPNVTSQAINPSGNQNNIVEGAPSFVNPGKYEIPAGGLEGYYGPNLNFLMSDYQQTLVNASVTTSDDSGQTITRLSFAKYLREPGEIVIDPLNGPTLILYAVAPIDDSGLYVNENPQWKYINMILGGSSKTRSSQLRKRQHANFDD